MMKRTWFWAVLAMVVTLSLVTACATPTPQVVEKVVEKTVVVTKVVEKVVEKPVEVVVTPTPAVRPGDIVIKAMGYGGPSDITRVTNLQEAAGRLNKKFKAEGKDIRIILEVSEFETAGDMDGFRQRFVLASQAGTAPCIRTSSYTEIPEWVEAGYIIPLDEYIEQYPDVFGDTFEALWKAVTWKGKRYGVLQDTEVRVVFYRKDKLKELGWSDEEIEALPQKVMDGEFTLDDLIAVAQESVEKGVTKWGIYHRPSKGNTFLHPYLAYGGVLQDPETGKLVLDETAALGNLEFHYNIAQVAKVTPPEITSYGWRDGIHPAVVKGETLFWFGGTWHWAEYQRVDYGQGKWTTEDMKKIFGVMLYPAAEKGGKPVTSSNPYVYMISSSCQTPDLAFQVIAEASSPDLVVKHALESGHLAWRKAALEVEAYKQDEFTSSVTPYLEYTSFMPAHPQWNDYLTIWYNTIQGVELGELTPEEALDFLKNELQAALGDELIIVE
ncbi:MAG TPA: extracellular solute-binding protein [Caldilineae bacterium]|nr:extracellular solute-binding protein [Caldilineae bacterium]